ncbi:ExeM/NucH family extracellular endonuclease [Geodermatophilus sp. URMC 61]|uniref:ExeM/NucH family extracellular endonuclease n=1 Tax=Geodermatophilus sp. URMC 61 TaxID=3423411 RepID=UPI00406BEAD0
MQPPTRPGRGAGRAAVGVTAVGLAVAGLPALATAAPPAPHVSDVHYDNAGTGSGEIVGSESTPAGRPLSRTQAAPVWSGPAAATRGVVDGVGEDPAPEPVDVCAAPVTHPIGAVQGSGAATTLAGRTVTLRGTVVGDLQGPDGFEGFHLQDAGDGDPATSDGVFVLSTVPVALGDEVAVTGVPGESSGQTQVTASTGVSVCADDLLPEPAPASLDLPADDAARERLEGMLVQPADALTVSEVFALTRYGELTLAEGGVLVQPTEVASPGTPEAAAVVAGNAARKVLLDDGRDDSRSLTDRPYLSPDSPVRVGDVLDLTGPLVLGYGFGEWRLQPADGTADGVFEPDDTRTEAPGPVGGDVRLATFNVLNYFLTFGDTGRGAENQEEFEEQAGKIVPAIRALGADVVTLLEIEDTDTTGLTPGNADTALADLVRRLDEAAGAEVWAYVPLPQELYAVPRDAIRNGIVYRTDRVQPVGDPVGLADESVWANAREPQAQTFAADGDAFTVVANHFKSKSPGDATGDNVDDGDGQGQWNGDRVRQARSVAAFAAGLAQRTGDPDVVLMGDLNAYSQEDPVEELRAAGWTDLGERFDPGRYSYVFDGLSGSLDHALATAALTAKVTDVVHWNVNSVESPAYQYDGDPALYAADPYRSSDHDPLVVGIDLDERCQGLVPTVTGTEGDDVLHGTNGRDVVMGLGGDDELRGGNGDDVLCGGAGTDTVAGDNGADVLLGGLGDDALDGGNGDDTLVGGPGEDLLQEGRGSGTREQEGPAA